MQSLVEFLRGLLFSKRVVREQTASFEPKQAAEAIASRAEKLYSGPHRYAPADPADFPGLNHPLSLYNGAQIEFESLGFRHLGDAENITVSEVSGRRTLLRRFTGEQDTIFSAVYQSNNLFYLDLETEFTDGSFLCTSNTGDTVRTSAIPGITSQRQPQKTALPELLAIHREKLAELIAQGAVPRLVANMEECHAAQHRMQALKNRHRQANGYVDMTQVKFVTEKKGDPEQNAKIIDELNAIQRKQPSSPAPVPPTTPKSLASSRSPEIE